MTPTLKQSQMKKYLFLLGVILFCLHLGLDAQELERRYSDDDWTYYGEVNNNGKLTGKGRQVYWNVYYDYIREGIFEDGKISDNYPFSCIWEDKDFDRSFAFNYVPKDSVLFVYFKYKDFEARAGVDSLITTPSELSGEYNGILFHAQPILFKEQGHRYMSFSVVCFDTEKRAISRTFFTQPKEWDDWERTQIRDVMDSCDELMRILQHPVSQEWISFYENNLKGKTFVYQDYLNAEKRLLSTYVIRFYDTQEAFFVRECSIDPEFFKNKTRREAIEKQRIGDAFSSPESFYEVSFENETISFKKIGKVVYDLTPEEERQQRAMAGLTQNHRALEIDESRKRYVIPYEENTCGIYSGKNYKIDNDGNLFDIDLGITLIATDTELKEAMLKEAINNSQTIKGLDAVLTMRTPPKGEPLFHDLFLMEILQTVDEDQIDSFITVLQELQ